MELEMIRKEIDRIDRDMVDLLVKRMELARMTADHKPAVEDAPREAAVIDNVKRYAEGRLDRDLVEKLFVRIMEESKRQQGMGD